MAFPFYQQPDHMDLFRSCLRGAAQPVVRMVAKHYGRSISLEKLRKISETTRAGSSLQGISFAAETIGFKTLGIKIDFENLLINAPVPFHLLNPGILIKLFILKYINKNKLILLKYNNI